MQTESNVFTKMDRRLIVTLCLLIVFGNINLTMFNLAISAISSTFSLSSSQASWVMVGYSIVMAVGAGAYSKLSESFSFRHLYAAGLLLFAAGSFLGFFASSFTQVIAGRLVQAAGAASISPLSYGITAKFFSPRIRGRVLGILSATIAFVSGFGPVFGGFIGQYAGWHTLFLISGACILVLPLVLKTIPDTECRHGSVDILGMLLFSTGMAFLMIGITAHLLFGFAGLAALGCFWFHIRRTSQPFLSPGLLKNARYRRTLWVAFITFLCNTGLTFILPILMKSTFHMPTGRIGLLMIPGAAAAALLGSAIGRWSDRYGSLRILMLSQIFVIAGFVLLSFFTGFQPIGIAFLMMIPIIGFNGMLTASGKLISLALEQSQFGMGMGVFTLAYLLGGAFGPALVGRFLDFKVSFAAIYLIFAAIAALSLLLALLLRKTGSKQNEADAE